jgi:hypothetical protein
MTQQKIPLEIYEIYKPLFNQVSHLHAKWGIFCQLYASSSEIIDLLNSSAAGFFRVCQDVLAYDILLTISRLTDPKQTGKRDNLSLERLVSSIDGVKFPSLRGEIEQLLAVSKVKCSFARELRNKLIAHNDLSENLQSNGALISMATKKNIEDAFESIRDVMNAVASHFESSTVAYELTSMPSDGKVLIARLRDAKEYRTHLRRLEASITREA